jgi:nucleoside-diphosphate-sugar epimerase
VKALLLGGGGFIGKALTPFLSIHLDLTVATSQNRLELPPGVRKAVAGDYRELDLQLDLSEFDRVIDCSWEGLPDLGASMNAKNLESKLALIRFLKDVGIAEYNGFGSCLEYGSLSGAVDEKMIGLGVSDFGLTKLKILDTLQESGMAYRWFRPFYLVGVGQHSNSLFNSTFQALRQGLDFSSRSNTSTSFDFLEISDFARGVSLAIQSNSVWGVVNLGSGKTYSIEEVINQFRLRFCMEQRVATRSEAMCASTQKLSDITGWIPNFDLNQMVSRFIEQKERAR